MKVTVLSLLYSLSAAVHAGDVHTQDRQSLWDYMDLLHRSLSHRKKGKATMQRHMCFWGRMILYHKCCYARDIRLCPQNPNGSSNPTSRKVLHAHYALFSFPLFSFTFRPALAFTLSFSVLKQGESFMPSSDKSYRGCMFMYLYTVMSKITKLSGNKN